jgi:2-dehydropantoate 2-reductase
VKILFFGRGVIATQYAWALEKAGHTVAFYVRPGKAAQLGNTVKLDIRDGRSQGNKGIVQEKWQVTLHESLELNHDYDLIVLSVNHHQIAGAVEFLSSRLGKATLLVFNNFFVDPVQAIAPIPLSQVVWGFPGGGGGFYDDGTLHGGFMKLMFLGKIGSFNLNERYDHVRKLFKNAGFSILQSRDFRSWLWFHFVMNAGTEAIAVKVGGYGKVFDSTKNAKQSLILMREMLPLLKAKGDKTSLSTRIMLRLPSGLTGFILHKATKKGSIGRDIMEHCEISGHVTQEANNTFFGDVLHEARRLGVSLPQLESLQAAMAK